MNKRAARIGLLSFSSIPDDPRVRKQGDTFHRAGWEVVAIGVDRPRADMPEWRCLSAGEEPAGPTGYRTDPVSKGLRFAHRQFERLIRSVTTPGMGWSEAVYWSMNLRLPLIRDLALQQEVDVWLANDWLMLPIARLLAERHKTPYLYDTHELAADEYSQRLRFRLIDRPLIRSIEKRGIRQAAFASCVSSGIAAQLKSLHDLDAEPEVIRNAPIYQQIDHRPAGDRIKVLYHGVVTPERGLEACIASVKDWPDAFHFTIRGPVGDGYRAHLIDLARAHGVSDRVTLEPPVAVTDLVTAASAHDVGLFALEGHSLQNVHVLPNKFFEYMMAGLALCVSDLPQMSAILRRHDLGRTIDSVTPEAIAAAMNSLTRDGINRYKQASLEAARHYNWETEVTPLVTAASEAVRKFRATQRPTLNG